MLIAQSLSENVISGAFSGKYLASIQGVVSFVAIPMFLLDKLTLIFEYRAIRKRSNKIATCS